MNKNLSALSRRVTEQRVARQLSITKAARLIGCSQSTLSRIEAGEQRPTPDLLQAIATALDLDLHELLEFAGHPLPADRDETNRVGDVEVSDLPPEALRELATFVEVLRRRYADRPDDRRDGLTTAG